MKCCFVIDVDVNPAAMPASELPKLRYRIGKVVKTAAELQDAEALRRANLVPVPILPTGTIYEHPDAYNMVRRGYAEPADDECAEACGLTEDERKELQRRYQRQELIHVEDWPLYDQGVIVGYDPESPDGFIHGPNWQAYQDAMQAIKQQEEDGDDE